MTTCITCPYHHPQSKLLHFTTNPPFLSPPSPQSNSYHMDALDRGLIPKSINFHLVTRSGNRLLIPSNVSHFQTVSCCKSPFIHRVPLDGMTPSRADVEVVSQSHTSPRRLRSGRRLPPHRQVHALSLRGTCNIVDTATCCC